MLQLRVLESMCVNLKRHIGFRVGEVGNGRRKRWHGFVFRRRQEFFDFTVMQFFGISVVAHHGVNIVLGIEFRNTSFVLRAIEDFACGGAS